jgi:hypothetical protein
MKVATVALVVEGETPALLDVISDDQEIHVLESSSKAGEADLLKAIQEFRQRQTIEEEQFGQYVEELLSQPFLRSEIQDHGLQWLKSKIKIEQFHRSECEAAKIIAEYAMKILVENPEKKDFFLSGPKSMVRIRVFSQKRHRSVAA